MSEQNEQNAMAPNPQTSLFESIRHTDESGDYWMARELMPLLEYSSWQKFEDAIQRAMTDCAKSGRDAAENFNLEG
jgi:DNA-damage-inducible protein D